MLKLNSGPSQPPAHAPSSVGAHAPEAHRRAFEAASFALTTDQTVPAAHPLQGACVCL